MNRRIVIAGGSGFLGRMLQRHFVQQGDEVSVLSRSVKESRPDRRMFHWDGRTVGNWLQVMEGADSVINLAGRSVDCRYNSANRRLIMESRVNSTRCIGDAIRSCRKPPALWLNASTATIYRHSYDRFMTESEGEIGDTPEARDAFSIAVARAWEEAFFERETPGTRKVAMRAAMVLGADRGGVYQVLRRLVRMGLGGRMGHGRQFVSWIHESDFCRSVDWLMAQRNVSGVVNLAAPEPVSNERLMATLRVTTRMAFGLPATRWMLEIGAFFLRTETELILKSRRVLPERLTQGGFQFEHPRLRPALEELEARVGARELVPVWRKEMA